MIIINIIPRAPFATCTLGTDFRNSPKSKFICEWIFRGYITLGIPSVNDPVVWESWSPLGITNQSTVLVFRFCFLTVYSHHSMVPEPVVYLFPWAGGRSGAGPKPINTSTQVGSTLAGGSLPFFWDHFWSSFLIKKEPPFWSKKCDFLFKKMWLFCCHLFGQKNWKLFVKEMGKPFLRRTWTALSESFVISNSWSGFSRFLFWWSRYLW